MSTDPPGTATLSVQPDRLIAAAGSLVDETRTLREELAAVDAAVADALIGWVGRSQAALADSAAQWATAAVTMTERLRRLETSLRTAAVSFSEMDAAHAATLSPPPAPPA